MLCNYMISPNNATHCQVHSLQKDEDYRIFQQKLIEDDLLTKMSYQHDVSPTLGVTTPM
jgi:hypothetical protein